MPSATISQQLREQQAEPGNVIDLAMPAYSVRPAWQISKMAYRPGSGHRAHAEQIVSSVVPATRTEMFLSALVSAVLALGDGGR